MDGERAARLRAPGAHRRVAGAVAGGYRRRAVHRVHARRPSAAGCAVNWWALFPLLSIGLALFAAWCAFRLRSPGCWASRCSRALVHLSRFYYFYGTTLMWKSAIMLILGALLLAAGVALRRQAVQAEGAA